MTWKANSWHLFPPWSLTCVATGKLQATLQWRRLAEGTMPLRVAIRPNEADRERTILIGNATWNASMDTSGSPETHRTIYVSPLGYRKWCQVAGRGDSLVSWMFSIFHILFKLVVGWSPLSFKIMLSNGSWREIVTTPNLSVNESSVISRLPM